MLINLEIEELITFSVLYTKHYKFNKVRYNLLKGNSLINVNSIDFQEKYTTLFKKEILINHKVLDLLNSDDRYNNILALKLIENKCKIKILNDE